MQVTELWVYPVKSLRGHRVASARVERRGLAGDRRWMLVDDAGRFVTQREQPGLSAFHATLGEQAITIAHRGETFELPRSHEHGDRALVEVWRHRGEAVVHADASRWFTTRLGFGCRAVYMPEDVERPVNPARGRPGDIVSFADGYPLLLISRESLELLNSKVATPLAMERFRPSVVVAGATPHAEDSWARLAIGGIPMRGVKPCDRCVITTIDPETGARGEEPLRTLATYRKREGAVWFGMNVVPDAGGTIRVGDVVEVLADGN